MSITNSGESAIQQEDTTDNLYERYDSNLMRDTFQIREIAEWILKNKLFKVGLQFPDNLLSISCAILRDIKRELKQLQQPQHKSDTTSHTCELAILGDTSYAHCCVDLVAARRFCITALVHFGHACLSPLLCGDDGEFRVFYAFGRDHHLLSGPTQHCVNDWITLSLTRKNDQDDDDNGSRRAICISCDLSLLSLTERLLSNFQNEQDDALILLFFPQPISFLSARGWQRVYPTNHTSLHLCFYAKSQCRKEKEEKQRQNDRFIQNEERETASFSPPCSRISISAFCFIGPQPLQRSTLYVAYLSIRHLLSTSHTQTIVCIDSTSQSSGSTDCVQPEDCTKQLEMFFKRRLKLIRQAREANRIGILTGTLSVSGYLAYSSRLQRLLQHPLCGKRSYNVALGKINVAKLANFAASDLDMFVQVGCGEGALLLDAQREFFRPVITAFELEVALWSQIDSTRLTVESCAALPDSVWLTDFRQIATDSRFSEEKLEECMRLAASSADHTSGESVAPDISVLDGRILDSNLSGCEIGESGDSEQKRRQETRLMELEAARRGRDWFGLDPAFGQTPVERITQGRRGIAIGYECESQTKRENNATDSKLKEKKEKDENGSVNSD